MSVQQKIPFKQAKGYSKASEVKFLKSKAEEKAQWEKADPSSDPKKDLDCLALLKEFDHTLEYGPAAGITRLTRWNRAQKYGLNPPQRIKEILEKHKDNCEFTESLWNSYNL
eukprot:m.40139 g.40139  ORF g.40139 m.40139 type:complete len:112 (+) comp32910_c0_seq3:90-425(+)